MINGASTKSIRNPFSYQPWRAKKTFAAMFDVLEADIVILQETKIQRKDLQDDMVLVPGWDCYFSLPKYEKGKFGVVIYTRQSTCTPIRAEEGLSGILCPPNSSTSFRDLPAEEQIGGYPTVEQAQAAPDASELSGDFSVLDSEGRCMILEFPGFVLIGVYNPATRDDARNAFRIGFLNLLDLRVRNLAGIGKRVVLAGDLNIVKEELDMANAEVDLRKRGTSIEEYFSMPPRRMLNQLLENGKVRGVPDESRNQPVLYDICRSFHPHRKGMFTCWETKVQARPGNYGSRIDYILCSLDMRDWFEDSNIQEGLMGSDHCPVYATIKDIIQHNGVPTHIKDLTNPPGTFVQGQRLREYSTKDQLTLSGRLLPEFNRRRNIRDMFSRKPSLLEAESIDETAQVPSESAIETAKVSNDDKADKTDDNFHSQPHAASPQRGIKRRGSEKVLDAFSKKSKPHSASTDASLRKGQQSLKGFFKPTASANKNMDEESPDLASVDTKKIAEVQGILNQPLHASIEEQSSASQAQEKDVVPGGSQDPAKSIESWSKLFARPVLPRCEGHDEPCKVMVTKKPGVNCGRSFYMCAKPLGPSGMKEKATEWRCRTFIWCSDWGLPSASDPQKTPKDNKAHQDSEAQIW
ncbi:MAG: hypothetical protein LQ340_000202 [Diploschistes diacapsis]|nr:MAG: hypothetical protein LQ340_000202 [Diploschistes diacapsis]